MNFRNSLLWYLPTLFPFSLTSSKVSCPNFWVTVLGSEYSNSSLWDLFFSALLKLCFLTRTFSPIWISHSFFDFFLLFTLSSALFLSFSYTRWISLSSLCPAIGTTAGIPANNDWLFSSHQLFRWDLGRRVRSPIDNGFHQRTIGVPFRVFIKAICP